MRERFGTGVEMVWRLLSHPGSRIDGHVGSESVVAKPGLVAEGYKRETPVDDNSLMAIVVLVMVVWEFLQLAIREKTLGQSGIGKDARDKEDIFESPSFGDMQKVDCSLSQRRNEE